MSAFTDPSMVPIHSPISGTSIWTTGTTSTSTGRGGGASLRPQAVASRTAASAGARRGAVILLLVVFDDLGRPHARLRGIAAGVAKGLPRAERVPALTQLALDRVQPRASARDQG